MKISLRGLSTAAASLALISTFAGCGGGGSGSDGSDGPDKTITLGYVTGWTDGEAASYIWKHVLEEEGYTVELEGIADAAPLYTGVANGDIDVYPSAWSEVTHADYLKAYGDDLEDLGAYYDNAVLTFAVPEYTEIDSIAEMRDNAELFDGRITGVEPGAGMMKLVKETVMPDYGLEDNYELVESSTAAMIAALQDAIDSKEDIVVTTSHPFWIYDVFPLKDLEDPKGTLGDAERLHAIATKGFSKDYPEVAEMFANFTLEGADFDSLQSLMVNEYGEGSYDEAVDEWLEARPGVLDSITES